MAHARAGVVPLSLGTLLSCAAARGQAVDWHEAHVLCSHASSVVMTYDAARERSVLCTGATWEWDGRWWTQRAPLPAGVTPVAMSFNAARRRCVLVGFAGAYPFNYSLVVCESDGTAWSRRPSAHVPPPRTSAALTFDPVRARTILFGGVDAQSNDTWEWDGIDWTRVVTAHAPGPRQRTAMAFDAVRGRAVLFGGVLPSWTFPTIYGDTWEYDGADWTLVAQGGPLPRMSHALVFDASNRRVVLHSGSDPAGPLDDTWSWDGVAWTPVISPQSPGARTDFALAYDSARQRIVRCGGRDGVLPSFDTWELGQNSWQLVEAETAPSARQFTALAYDRARGRTVLFGDVTAGDTWEWDGVRWERMLIPGAVPPPRYGHGMAYDSARQRTVICGGTSGNVSLSDTWEWDGSSWTLRATAPVSPPSGFRNHMAYDENRRRCVFWNGWSVYEWDGAVWVPAPGPATQSWLTAMAYDGARQRIVLQAAAPVPGTWTYDGVAWVQARPRTPLPVFASIAMTWDRARRLVVALGRDPDTGMQTWYWNGVDWAPAATATEPPLRGDAALAYDEARAEVVLFGGNAVTADTWLLGATSPAVAAAFGTGCGGASAAPVLTGSDPYLGNDGFALEVRCAAPAAPCVLAAALAPASLPLGGGCTLLLQLPVATAFAPTNAAGVAWVHVGVPARPDLRGFTAYWQAAVVEPRGPLGGVALTQGLRTVAGS